MATQRWYLSGYLDNFGSLTATPQSAATLTSGWIVGTGSTFSAEFNGWNTGDRLASSFVANTVPDGTFDVTWGDGFRSPLLNGTFASANWTFQFAVVSPVQGGAADGQIVFRLIKADYNGTSNASEITSAQQSASVCTNVASSPDSNGTLTFNPGAFTITNQYLFVQVAWKRTGAGGMTTTNIQLRTGVSATVGTTILTSDFTNATVLAPNRASTLVLSPPTVVAAGPAQAVTSGTVGATAALTAPTVAPGGTSAGWELKFSGGAVLGPSGGATGAVDTTGADLIVLHVSWYPGVTAFPTVSDNKGNTWVFTIYGAAANVRGAIWYSEHPTVGTGHTFSATGSSVYSSIQVEAWAGSAVSSYDQITGLGGGSGSPLTSPPLTPNVANSLLLTTIAHADNRPSTVSVDSGFTVGPSVPYTLDLCEGGTIAHQVQATIAAVQPSWTYGTSGGVVLFIVFKPGAAGPPPDQAVTGATIASAVQLSALSVARQGEVSGATIASTTSPYVPHVYPSAPAAGGWHPVPLVQFAYGGFAGATGGTTPPFDTRFCNLLVLHLAYSVESNFDPPPSITDNQGNTWVQATLSSQGITIRDGLWYCANPTTAEAHTLTLTTGGVAMYPSVQLTGWVGSAVDVHVFDARGTSTASASAATLPVGPMRPSAPGDLVIAGSGHGDNSAASLTLDTGFTVQAEVPWTSSTAARGGTVASLVQGAAASITPTWSLTNATVVCATIAAFKTVPLRAGLLAYYAMNESSGDALDSLGARPLTETPTIAAATGKVSGARDFEADAFVRFQRIDTAFSFPSGDFTLAVWVNVESLTAGRGIATYHQTSPDQPGDWQLKVATDGAVVFGHVPSGTTYTVTKTFTGLVSVGTWAFVAVRYLGGTYTVWVDGLAMPITPPASDFTGAATGFVVGYSGGGRFDGLLDEFAIWNTAKSDEDLVWLYNAGGGRAYTEFPGVSVGGAQAITGTTLATTVALTAPTLTALTLGATIPSGNARFPPTVTPIQAVTTGTRATTLQLFAPSVAAGPALVLLPPLPSTTQLFLPLVSLAGVVNIGGATLGPGAQLFLPTLAAGPVTVTLGTRASPLALFPVTLTPLTTGATIPSGSQLFPPSVAQTVLLGTRASTLTLGPPTVVAAPLTGVGTAALASTLVLSPPTVAPGPRTVTLPALGPGHVLSPPTVIAPGPPGTVVLGTIASTLALFPPSVARLPPAPPCTAGGLPIDVVSRRRPAWWGTLR